MFLTVKKRLQIISGSYYPQLADSVAKKLKTKVTPVELTRFANSEIKCQIEKSVRGDDVFVFQTHCSPVNEAIMEQAIMIDALKRASAKRITAVCPFLGYSRQDRKASGREPITAKLLIDILATAGANRIVTFNLHSGQVQGFFNGPFDHLTATPVLADQIRRKFDKDLVMVSPDAGGVKLAERYASRLNADLAIVHKRRPRDNEAEAMHLIGEVEGRHCVIVDDMIDTAGTVCAAADVLKSKGAKTVSIAATHGIFSDPAAERINKSSSIDYVVVTDTLPPPKAINKVEVVSIVDLLASAVDAIFEDHSVSQIFEGSNQI